MMENNEVVTFIWDYRIAGPIKTKRVKVVNCRKVLFIVVVLRDVGA